ncbi:hypothetical protein [Hyphomicrobium sp. MC1]|uniref:hypothetical protein n=1 Tax=Hyphomicrobium sp. (strain MC1) TaxID=717785 RepID=UPI000213DAB0|nr:hypothetical protein [Hyphomicrobium sp. MC1]CCB64469.1 conserved protein of unknown function [Hyphomicrobium sp. MC1]
MTTEKSADDAVLTDVFSSGRDRGGNDAPPAAPEATAQSETVAEPAEQASDAEPKGYRDPSTGRFVPLKELTTEREKRQAAEKAREEEARLRKESDERIAQMERRFQEIERNQRQAQNPPQPQQPPPDPFVDPAGALAFERQNFQQALLNQRLNFSEMMARNKFGDQAVDQALQAAQQAGVINEQWVARSRDFYGDLMNWKKRQDVLSRVGEDPEAYEKSIEERVRAKVLEELKTGNRSVMPGQAPAAQPQPQFPGSLADATASGPSAGHPQNDEALMGTVFGSGRKRK